MHSIISKKCLSMHKIINKDTRRTPLKFYRLHSMWGKTCPIMAWKTTNLTFFFNLFMRFRSTSAASITWLYVIICLVIRLKLFLQFKTSQNGQIHFKNLAANAVRFLKCVWPPWDVMRKRLMEITICPNPHTEFKKIIPSGNTSKCKGLDHVYSLNTCKI